MTKILRDLVRFRRKSGIQAVEVARKMGVSRQQVYNIESGRDGDPSILTLLRYAHAVGMDIVLVKKG